MSDTHNTPTEEGITFFGQKPAEVLDAFYASGLSALGFSISGRVVLQSAQLVNTGGENSNLFDGQKLYAGTFMRPTKSN